MNGRLTISTLACPNWTLRRIVDECARHGIAGIDVRGILGTLDHTLLPSFGSQADETKALLAAKGLSLPCSCSSIKLMTADADEWATSLDEFRRHLRVAETFDTPFVRIFPGQSPPSLSRGDAIELARHRARDLVVLAGPTATIPLLETHDDWGVSTEIIQLLADCEPDAFGVIWDVGHTWAAGELPATAIATLGPRLRHVHVKDSAIVQGNEQPALLGDGVVTVGPALAALKAAGYDGWICLETEKRWHPATAPEPEISLPQFVDFVRAI